MSTDTPDPETVAAAEARADLDVLRAEFRLRVLEELTEIGMKLTRSVGERAAAPKEGVGEDAVDLDAIEAYCRLARSIRLSVTLHAKAQEALSTANGAVAKARETGRQSRAQEAERALHRPQQDLEDRIRGFMEEVGYMELTEAADRERLDIEVEDRLFEDQAFWTDPNRTMREIIERYCGYFRLSPDWSRWTGEGWAPLEEPPEPWPWEARLAARDAARAPAMAPHDLQ